MVDISKEEEKHLDDVQMEENESSVDEPAPKETDYDIDME